MLAVIAIRMAVNIVPTRPPIRAMARPPAVFGTKSPNPIVRIVVPNNQRESKREIGSQPRCWKVEHWIDSYICREYVVIICMGKEGGVQEELAIDLCMLISLVGRFNLQGASCLPQRWSSMASAAPPF